MPGLSCIWGQNLVNWGCKLKKRGFSMFSPILLTIGDNIDKAFYAFDLWVFRFFGSMQCGF